MSGIPVYTSSPINAAKAAGVSPQTKAPEEQTTLPRNIPPPTVTAASTPGYPQAQPGQAAFPAPTAAPILQRYAPLQPTPTTQFVQQGPPAPQPGAVPTPLNKAAVPPPPKVGESYHPLQQTAAPTQADSTPNTYPTQMFIPPPTTNYRAQPPSSSTSTTHTASTSYPVPLPTSDYGAPRRSIEHPEGYQQNVYAAELTSDQRRAQEAQSSSMIGSKNSSEAGIGLDSESVWNTAKKWAQQAGEKVSAAEAEVWRKINKE